MPHPLPTILLFAGAFADPSCFDTLCTYFQKAGFPTTYAYVHSLNLPNPLTSSTSKDAAEAREKYLMPLLDANKDVIIFAHSYGGIVSGQAAAGGLSKKARLAQGKAGGVVGLIYLAGNIVGEGGTLLQGMGGAYPPFLKENHPAQGLAVIDPVMETLYNDVHPTLAPTLQEAMIPHALLAFETPAGPAAWAESEFDGRRAYIRTTEDQTIPAFVQDAWIEKSGVEWDVAELKASHCPFVSMPVETAEMVIGFVGKWI